MRQPNPPTVKQLLVDGLNASQFCKDAVLDSLAGTANVAQFVSYAPDLSQRYSRVHGYAPNHHFKSLAAALSALLEAAPDHAVNVRSFTPEEPKNREFIYGLTTVDDAAMSIRRLAQAGLNTIVNETVDVNDGGVSGVAVGNVVEFAPGDTPRCVEKPGIVSIERTLAMQFLETVYRFTPAIDYDQELRVEFSIHPMRRGFLHEHTIIWEIEIVGAVHLVPGLEWPNLFSRMIGDKAFGLLLAHVLGLPVSTTTVISRSIAPFSFGEPSGTNETWIRTCPVEQIPGRYTTQRGWRDPFRLLADEDPDGKTLASVLAQEGVEPAYSGALIAGTDGQPIIEGVSGSGDEFMIGHLAPERLPDFILGSVKELYHQASQRLGPIRCEWVHDGNRAWIVQLHRGATMTSGRTIYPGDANTYHSFDVADGLDALRLLVSAVEGTGEGIVLVGDVGVTSHLGDILRRARIPSRIETKPQFPSW